MASNGDDSGGVDAKEELWTSRTGRLIGVAPASWAFKESVTFIAPSGDANVIASSEPLGPDIDLARYVDVQGALLEDEFPGYLQLSLEAIEVFGTSGMLRVFEWSPPDSRPVGQMQVYAVLDQRGFTATATATLENFNKYESVFARMLLRLDAARHA